MVAMETLMRCNNVTKTMTRLSLQQSTSSQQQWVQDNAICNLESDIEDESSGGIL